MLSAAAYCPLVLWGAVVALHFSPLLGTLGVSDILLLPPILFARHGAAPLSHVAESCCPSSSFLLIVGDFLFSLPAFPCIWVDMYRIVVLPDTGCPCPFLLFLTLASFVDYMGPCPFLSLCHSDVCTSFVGLYFLSALAMSPSLLPDLAPYFVASPLWSREVPYPIVLVPLLPVPVV